MTAWLWVLGTLVVLVAVAVPHLRRSRPDPALDRARDLLSRLEFELDRADVPQARRAEAERCRTLAGSALASGAGARAQRWAREGLAAIAPGRRS